jgi:hypothetical protein
MYKNINNNKNIIEKEEGEEKDYDDMLVGVANNINRKAKNWTGTKQQNEMDDDEVTKERFTCIINFLYN